jgi:hypothetical protein
MNNVLFSSCSPEVLILITTFDPYIHCFQNYTLFALLVINFAPSDVVKHFGPFSLYSVLYAVEKQVI